MKANAVEMRTEVFSFEVYTKNPDTGEEGYDIKHVRAFGTAYSDRMRYARAKAAVEAMPNFDTVITSTAEWNGTDLGDEDIRHWANGEAWYETDAREVN